MKMSISLKLISTRLLHTILLTLSLAFSLNIFALSLADAKSQGLVGEQPSGYLGAVGQSTGKVDALIKDINAKRRNAYKDIASKNKTPLSEIEKLAGKKAMEKTPSGQYIKQGGTWVKLK